MQVIKGHKLFYTSAVQVCNKAYVTSGFSAGSGPGYTIPTNDLREFDPLLNTCTQKAIFPGGIMRSNAIGFTTGDRGYILTGTGPDLMPWYTDIWEYDTETDTWMSVGRFPGEIRTYATGFSISDKGYIVSGWFFSLPQLVDVWEFTPSPEGINNDKQQGIIFTPNPFQYKLKLTSTTPLPRNFNLVIIDLTGRIVFSDNEINSCPFYEKSFDLQNLKCGIYFYSVKENNKSLFRGKIIKD